MSKVPKPIGAAAYEAALGKLVAEFEAKCATIRKFRGSPTGTINLIYQLVAEKPRTLAQIHVALGQTISIREVHSRLRWSIHNGMIQRPYQIDSTTPVRGRIYKSWVYIANPDGISAARQRALEAQARIFNARVEKLEQRFYQVRPCIAARVLPNIVQERTRQIVEARLNGVNLEEIGQEHGITRERVRQIISKVVTRSEERRVRTRYEALSSEIITLLANTQGWGRSAWIAQQMGFKIATVYCRLESGRWPITEQDALLAVLKEWAVWYTVVWPGPPDDPAVSHLF